MNLKKLKNLIEQVAEKNNLKETNNKRLYIHICHDKYGTLSSKDIGVTPYEYTVSSKKGQFLYENNEHYKKTYDDIVYKLQFLGKTTAFTDLFDKVREFRHTYELKVRELPSMLTKRDYDLHYKLGKEELNEYLDACEEGNMIEVLDALVDRMYILLGTILEHGMQDVFDDAFAEVHSSNMSKLQDGEVLKRDDGKILKGKDYFSPDLFKILKRNELTK